MKFGTLQSLRKEPAPMDAGRDEQSMDTSDHDDEFGGGGMDDDSEYSMDDFGSDDGETDETDMSDEGSPTDSIIDKLLSLRDEIEEILSDMGYADEDDDQFDGQSDMGDNNDEFDSAPDEFGDDSDQNTGQDQMNGDDFGDQQGPKSQAEFGDNNSEFGNEETTDEDPDFQGDIRTVKGADLVYKRKQEDGNFEELWIYNVGNDIRKETQIRKAILAGTDIVPQQRESEDGSQKCDTYTVGNVQYLRIFGLPN